MHKLHRQVRFSINPFLDEDIVGANSFASKPAGTGLALFFELGITLIGRKNPDTGFVVNIVEIDQRVRKIVVPEFAARIKKSFRDAMHIDWPELVGMLQHSHHLLKGKFKPAMVGELTLKLNPYRKIAIDCEAKDMVYLSEKFEFAAMHKLWNPEFSEKKNFQVFGKCANPGGHGHNYTLEVTVKTPSNSEQFHTGNFEQVVNDEFIELVDHKNLNQEVDFFSNQLPTVENIAVLAWNKLHNKLSGCHLHAITIWETEKTYCTYYG